MKCYFRKMPDGALVADNDETSDWLQKVKAGAVVGGEFTKPRNYRFLKKTMLLFETCFKHFVAAREWDQTYKGMVIEPSFVEFRKDLTILAGHFTVTFDIRGKAEPVAKSLSYANCSEEEAEKIYSDVIDAALKHVYEFSISDGQLRKIVDEILRFS